ncbi:nose resistant to fluoxetine protein 6 [Nephila pilipes]|uniref:Nose resistant to fluoxetine protein 6 n=1 Tax=Nephila pilipes TaxID=299642 RepID=A0A8X6PEF5_NEPPI|nr:nose resistant to fluoxetine protein 6 [Nephila pilipes]
MTIEDSCPHVDAKFLYKSRRYTGKGIIHHPHVCIMYVDNAFSRKAGLKVIGNRGLECVCMGWTWYLANDMQFYVISPLFLITLWWVPKIGFSLLAFAFIANFSSIFALTYVHNLVPGFGNIAHDFQNFAVFLDR